MLVKYDDSPAKLVQTLFPKYEWLPWKFNKVPNSFWENKENKKTFVEWVSKELNIKNQEDWYNIDPKVRRGRFSLFSYKKRILLIVAEVRYCLFIVTEVVLSYINFFPKCSQN